MGFQFLVLIARLKAQLECDMWGSEDKLWEPVLSYSEVSKIERRLTGLGCFFQSCPCLHILAEIKKLFLLLQNLASAQRVES